MQRWRRRVFVRLEPGGKATAWKHIAFLLLSLSSVAVVVLQSMLEMAEYHATLGGMKRICVCLFTAEYLRSADCVAGGFRYLAKEKLVGSSLLGLYDAEGLLHHAGFTSAITASKRAELTEKLLPFVQALAFTGRAPGEPSWWSTDRSFEWVPLKPELVLKVRYDHFAGHRFRHDQVEHETVSPLGLLPSPQK